MGGKCSTHERNEKCVQNFGRKNLRGRDHSINLDADEKVKIKR